MTARLAKRAAFVLALIWLLFPAAPPAQTPQPVPQPSAFGDQISVGYVLVPVVVRSKNGFAQKLSRDDFRVEVDDRPIEIESFESGALAPIAVLFLQDLSGSMGIAPKLAQSRRLIECVMGKQRSGDEFALATFSDRRLFVEVPFPGIAKGISEVLSSWEGYGRTALHDAVAWLPDLVHASASPRRAVVLITDGVDNASAADPTEARNEIRQAEVPVHVVGLETGSPFTLKREGGKLHPLADILNLIGWATGGGYHPVAADRDIRAACSAIVDDLRHQYVLGFSTRGGESPARHEIEVEVVGKGKKLDVRFRHSYEGTRPLTIESSR